MDSDPVEGSVVEGLPAFPRQNNLTLVRLLLATQVVLFHISEHIAPIAPPWVEHVPGVPAFFFVSGFLVYASYRHAPGRTYALNRFLRLYPGLVAVTVGALAVVLVAQGWQETWHQWPVIGRWLIMQLSVGQSYNPDAFRHIGVGVMNGSLWTITTELLFYACIPALVWVETRVPHALLGFMIVSFGIYAFGPHVWVTPVYRGRTWFDVLALTPIVWGWMFGFGILAVRFYGLIRLVVRWFWLWLGPMTLMSLVGAGPLFGADGNRLGLFYFIAYVGFLLYLAFGVRASNFDNDFSYGLYVWHMPLINLILVLNAPRSAILVFGLVTVTALSSWFFIEKPCLGLKRRSLTDETRSSHPARGKLT